MSLPSLLTMVLTAPIRAASSSTQSRCLKTFSLCGIVTFTPIILRALTASTAFLRASPSSERTWNGRNTISSPTDSKAALCMSGESVWPIGSPNIPAILVLPVIFNPCLQGSFLPSLRLSLSGPQAHPSMRTPSHSEASLRRRPPSYCRRYHR